MPNPSHKSSSVLSKSSQDEYRNGATPASVKSSSDLNHSKQSETDSKDWFYGTEELLDALPQVWTRSMLYLMVGFAAIIIPWLMLSKVDETGAARGRVEPQGATQRLDAAAAGSVTAVNVKEGDTVKAGQLLVELESDVLRTDLQQAQTKLQGEQNQLAQLELLKNQLMLSINVTEQQNRAQELEKLSQVQQAQQSLDAKQTTYNLQKLEKLAQVYQAEQNVHTTLTTFQLSKNRLSRDLAEVQRYHQLWQQGVVPQTKVVELQKVADETQQLLLTSESDMKQAQLRLQEQTNSYQMILAQAVADIKLAKLRLQEQQSSYQSVVQASKLALLKSQEQLKDLQSQTTARQSEIGQIKSQIQSLNLQLQQRVVRSPIDGVIFELPIEKPGSVVQAGQMIAQVAPKGSTLILKAQMSSEQSGFLREGMPVKIKFDAYPFQDYGVVQGHVTWISPDSKIQESNSGRIETYELKIALQQPYIQAGNKRIPLIPGQTATAEIIIRERRVVDFILDPFKKLQKGGLEL
ncbi:HlyD family secretion protein [Nostocales cyanobacterium HT-58-2]|nr:HlyD family secretion protein [Nostocales cyanobacterium HT-58-2]